MSRGLLVRGVAVHRRASVDQRLGDGAGTGKLTRQPEPVAVKPHHRDVAERLGAHAVRPVLHLPGRQLWVLGQEPGEAGQVAAVEDIATFYFELELRPAGESVLAGERQLCRGEDKPAR